MKVQVIFEVNIKAELLKKKRQKKKKKKQIKHFSSIQLRSPDACYGAVLF